MNRRWFALIAVGLAWMAAVMVLVYVSDGLGSGVAQAAWAAAPEAEPTIIEVDPTSAPNDLDTPIVITGTNFEDGADVLLDGTSLEDVSWAGDTRLEATVPWGMDPGVYDLTVVNPGGESDDLPNAFTVTQGIGVWNASQLYGGSIKPVVVNPVTPTTVYAVGSHHVGIFRSRDGGETWSFIFSPDAHDLVLDPITPTTLYWGNGGLYRSDDEVDSWHWLGEPQNVPYPHPTISQTLYASSRDSSGLWKSTDRGQTWVTATNGLTDTEVTGLVFHPTDPMTMYVGTANGNIFRSTNGGDSWSHVAQPLNYILTLGINPRGAHELWVSNHCVNSPNYTLKSTNPEHTTWITVAEPVGSESLESMDFPPDAWGDAYSQSVFAQGCWGTPYRSEDNGDTWEELPLSQAAVQDMALHPTISETLYGGTKNEGVLKSEDGGQTYHWINEGITALYPLQMATVPGQPDVVYAVAERDGGIYKGTRGGADWEFLEIEGLYGRGSVVAVDPFTPTRVYAASSAPSHLGTGWWVHISEDAGQTWPTYTFVSAPEVYSDCNNVGPLVMQPDREHPGHMLAGVGYTRFGDPIFNAGGIYRSTDHGRSWTYIDIDVGEHISEVLDIAYDGEIAAVVYAATGRAGTVTGSGMLRSTDGGQRWQPIGEGIAALDAVWSIAVEPRSPHRVFAMTFDDGVYLSANHGLTWTQATSKWFSSEEILCTDEAPSWLYAATGGGLLRSDNGGQSWSRAAGVLGQVPVYSLATVRDGERVILYAGTTGGYVEGDASGRLGQVNSEGTLVNAGVYRYTTLRGWRVYLPLVVRQQ
jgi:photosystem II stability/assembly factor-like uncharacterized protein